MTIIKLMILCVVIIMILLPIEMILALIYSIHKAIEFIKEMREKR